MESVEKLTQRFEKLVSLPAGNRKIALFESLKYQVEDLVSTFFDKQCFNRLSNEPDEKEFMILELALQNLDSLYLKISSFLDNEPFERIIF